MLDAPDDVDVATYQSKVRASYRIPTIGFGQRAVSLPWAITQISRLWILHLQSKSQFTFSEEEV